MWGQMKLLAILIYMVVFFKREKGNEKKNISIEGGSK